MNYYTIQIPVSIAYHLPLGKDFQLILALGTNIDVYSKQRMDFDQRVNITDAPNKTHVDVNSTNLLFNNIVFSPGIEKRWNRPRTGFVYSFVYYDSKSSIAIEQFEKKSLATTSQTISCSKT